MADSGNATSGTIGIGAIAVGVLLLIGIMHGTWQKLLSDVFGSSSGSGSGGTVVTPPTTPQVIAPVNGSCPQGFFMVNGVCEQGYETVPGSGGLAA